MDMLRRLISCRIIIIIIIKLQHASDDCPCPITGTRGHTHGLEKY